MRKVYFLIFPRICPGSGADSLYRKGNRDQGKGMAIENGLL